MKKKILLSLLLVLVFLTFVGCNKDKNDTAKHYNFYNVVSTLPTTYSVLNTHSDKSESFILFARRGTFGQDSLGENAVLFETSETANKENLMDILAVSKKIKELYDENNKNTFTFFVDDLNVQYFLDAMIPAGIPYAQMKLVIITDGTATYAGFDKELLMEVKETVTKDGQEVEETKTVPSDDANAIEKFNAAKKAYNDLLEEYEFGETLVGYENGDRTPATYSKDGKDVPAIKSYLAVLAIAQGGKGFEVEWWVQYPECIGASINKDLRPQLYAEFEKANFVKKQPVELYNKLDESAKVAFLDSSLKSSFEGDVRMGLTIDYAEDGVTIKGYHNDTSAKDVNTNTIPYTKAYLDNLLYGSESNKPVLIFSGGSADAMGMTGLEDCNFEKTVKTIVKAFGSKYEIVFKPHPNYIPSGYNLDILTNNGINIVLPGRLPMELLLYAYPGVKCGGYNSSLYMSANAEDVLFFVGGLSGSVAYCFDKDTNASHVMWFSNPALESEIK